MDNQKLIEIEKNLIGSILVNQKLLNVVELSKDDFITQNCGVIFAEMVYLDSRKTAFDLSVMDNHLQSKTGRDWFAVLTDTISLTASSEKTIESWASIIRNSSKIRAAFDISQRFAAKLSAVDITSANVEAISETISELMSIDSGSKNHEYNGLEMLKSAIDEVELIYESGGKMGIPSCLAEVNEITGGYHRGDMVTIAARPGIGKTALAINDLIAATEAGYKGAIFSTEQGVKQVGLRYLSIKKSINAARIRNGSMSDDEWVRLCQIHEKEKEALSKIKIFDKSSLGLTDIQRLARQWKHQEGLDIVFIDYIQRLRKPKGYDERQTVAEAAQGLKNLACDLDIAVVPLAQLNRSADGSKPKISQIKWAGEVEQESDSIYMIHEGEDSYEIIIGKNRHGPKGDILCEYVGKYLQFKDRFNKEQSQYFSNNYGG